MESLYPVLDTGAHVAPKLMRQLAPKPKLTESGNVFSVAISVFSLLSPLAFS
jgi:hypothetical protein